MAAVHSMLGLHPPDDWLDCLAAFEHAAFFIGQGFCGNGYINNPLFCDLTIQPNLKKK
jgi:hypothetical protein